MDAFCAASIANSTPVKVRLPILSATQIVELHDSFTREWHIDPNPPDPLLLNPPLATTLGVWAGMIAAHHRANFDLWHIEDEARTPGASDAVLAGVKRRIDSTNTTSFDIPQNNVNQNQGFNNVPVAVASTAAAQPTGCGTSNPLPGGLYNCPSGLGIVKHTIGAPRQVQMSLHFDF